MYINVNVSYVLAILGRWRRFSVDTKLWRSGESNPTKSHNQGLKMHLYNYISNTELYGIFIEL